MNRKKSSLIMVLMITFVSVLLAGGCDYNREKKVEEAKENAVKANVALENALEEYDKDYKNFKDAAEVKITANEKSIAEFKVEMKTAGKKFQIKYEKEIKLLEQKNQELRVKISEYKYDGKNKWEEFKISFNTELDNVATGIKDFFVKKSQP